MSPQYGELRPTNGSDRFGSLGHPSSFQRVSRLASVTARHSGIVGVICGVEQRAPPIFGRAAITLGIGPHSSFNEYIPYTPGIYWGTRPPSSPYLVCKGVRPAKNLCHLSVVQIPHKTVKFPIWEPLQYAYISAKSFG